ncbi:sigma-70 family RNA polymerase sigma factor [Mycolicibacterium poriferae]|uniref:sigma-70 family RNA polymerase sigma factor n=1 Tax=Mycolicibacterium poriferae TaxID=39694 RepID=UPI0024B91E10|nr:sigma-70 family RNA polymerase sigma factor [Mycolicibacterium poriferae]
MSVETGPKTTLFESGVMPFADELRRTAMRLTRRDADADDLVQVTLEKAWRALDSFDSGTNMRAWLFRIMTNTWISSHRTAQRRPVEAELDESSLQRCQTPSAESQALRSQGYSELYRAMRDLPESQRIVVYYAFVEGRRYPEIADMLAIPVGTVMSRVHRARQTLRAELGHVGQPEATAAA